MANQGGYPPQDYPTITPPQYSQQYPPQYSPQYPYAQGPPPGSPPPGSPPGRPNSNRNLLIAIVAVLVALVGIGAGVLLTRGGGTTAGPGTSTPPTTPTATASTQNVPFSAQRIVSTLMANKTSGGLSVSAVKVLKPPWMQNGVEVAETNVLFSNNEVWHMHFVADPATGNWHLHTEFQVNSLDSTEGLNAPFPDREASVAGANGNE